MQERQWLLLPETATEWPGVEAMQGHAVLLTPPLLGWQPPGVAAATPPADPETSRELQKCTVRAVVLLRGIGHVDRIRFHSPASASALSACELGHARSL